jgi:hypothetical protein
VDSAQSWPQISLEEVVRQQPDFLIFAESHSETAPPDVEALSSLPGWRVLDAVRSRRYALVSDAVNRPALRIVAVIEDLAKQLHPEAFPAQPGSDKDSRPQNTAPPSLSLLSISPFWLASRHPLASEQTACAL